jgi:hypothetical protein
MKQRALRGVGAVLALAFIAGGAAAQAVDPPPPPAQSAGVPADFPNCDGFGPVTRVGDGMSQVGTGFWVAGGDRVRRAPAARGGVESCTRALQRLQAELPQFWLRRVSLLQARALHRLSDKDFAGALADLVEADQAVRDPSDVYYLRSMGINTDLIRAFALIQNGDRAGGEALAVSAWRRRLFSREVIGAALAIIGPEGDQANLDQLLHAAGRVDPSYSGLSFRYAFETGRYGEALERFAEIVPPTPIEDQTHDLRTRLYRQEHHRARSELFLLNLAGQRAYALAAIGRGDEALAVLGEAQARLDAATPAPEPLPARPSNRDRIFRAVREQANLEIQSTAPTIRDVWAGMTAARLAAGEGRVDEARNLIEELPAYPPSYAIVDIFSAMHADQAQIEAVRGGLPADRFGLPESQVRVLFTRLLDAETAERADSRMGTVESLFTSRGFRERGGCEERRQAEPLVNICYKGVEATLAVTEERALLRAAARARENGGRLRIESREDIRHSLVSTMYGVPMNQTQAGFESSLIVRFFGPEVACARCLSAGEIETALAGIYAAASE